MDTQQQKEWQKKISTAKDYREWVGPSKEFDVNAALQFNIMTNMGLRQEHKFLEIGCGSLRAGRLFINYLNPGCYFGIDPEKWLIDEAKDKEMGRDIFDIKKPQFLHVEDFSCQAFNQKFDFVICQGVFTHAPEQYIRKCVENVSQCMTDDSILAITYFKGKWNFEGTDWQYPATTTYTKKRFDEILKDSHLTGMHINYPHPHNAQWVVVFKKDFSTNLLKAKLRQVETRTPAYSAVYNIARKIARKILGKRLK